ncbi:MAG: ABC transporter ATP-binding protein [Eubacteriales bacterium]|nr:ABC transporter ATP-binding protein [Eubacteriales bacterium]
MDEKKMSWQEMIKVNLRGIRLIYSLIPWNMFLTVLYVVIDVIYSYWSYFFLARFVDDIVMHASRDVLLTDMLLLVVGQIVVNLLFKSMQMYYFYGGSNVWEEANAYLDQKLMSMDYEYMESETIQNKRRDIDAMARNNGGGLTILFWYATPVIERALQMLVAFGYMIHLISRCNIAFSGEPWKILSFIGGFILMFAILLFISMKKNQMAQEKIYQYNEENLPKFRQYNFYLNEYIGKEECGKTVRMFHQQKLLCGRTSNLYQKIHENINRISKVDQDRSQWVEAIEVSISGLIYLLLGIMVLKKAVTIGSVCMYAGCITNFLWHFRMWNSQWVELVENTKYVKMYFDFLDIPNQKYQGTIPVEKRDDDQFMIEFNHVSFRYPGSDQDVLKDFSIKFRIGERLAVVGKNGSGKTTFIKLLCRLYDPTEGEIRLNGIDIRKFDYKEYLSLFSVVFQDFKIPALPLGETIAVSSEYEEENVRAVLKRVGLGDLLEKMPQGLETPLYTDFDKNGVDISGGEAQKVAIARALYHDTPFVILDEPTAALDPLAEYEIYSKFDELVGSKTAVYISHRLSSCQFCNDILVIDGGKAVQRGSHEELVQEKNGLYYTLWHTQARYYQEAQEGC